MARRNVLNGATDWEREAKANQQRDYAAQLQEQVRLKQAKQEQEKQRKLQEQREELEMLEREKVAPSRKPPPQQQEQVVETPPVAQTQSAASTTPHTAVLESQERSDPLKLQSVDSSVKGSPELSTAGQELHETVSMPATHGDIGSYGNTFSSAPSIFECLLREPGIGARSTSFYEDLAALQKLSAELDSAAKQRSTKAQSEYIKPNFINQQEASPVASNVASTGPLCSSLVFRDEKIDLDNQNEPEVALPSPQNLSDHDVLRGESVLLPLHTTTLSPPKSLSKSHATFTTSSQRRHHFVSRPRSPSDLSDDLSTMVALRNHSEMLQFAATKK